MISRQAMVACVLASTLAFGLAGCGGGATSTSSSTSTGTTGTGLGSLTGSGLGPIATCPANSQLQGYTPADDGTAIHNASSGGTIALTGPGAAAASAIYMDQCAVNTANGPQVAANQPYVSVYLCAPGATPGSPSCGWVDHIVLDTGSVGLRVLAEAIPTNVLNALPNVPPAGSNGFFAAGSSGTAVGECYAFVSSYIWGGLRTADVILGGSAGSPTTPAGNYIKAAGLNIQVINDPNITLAPPGKNQDCDGLSVNRLYSATNLSANGILGIGLFSDDCNSAADGVSVSCNVKTPNTYYACNGNATQCSVPSQPVTGTPASNPVAVAGGNGVVVSLNRSDTAINGPGTAQGLAGVVTYNIPNSFVQHAYSADTTNAYLQTSLGPSGGALVNYPVGTGPTPAGNGGPIGSGSYIDSGSNAVYFTNYHTGYTPAPPPSTSFQTYQNIPTLYTCGGDNYVAPAPPAAVNPYNPFACFGSAQGGSGSLLMNVGFADYSAANNAANAALQAVGMTVNDTFSLFNGSSGPAYAGLTIVDPNQIPPGTVDYGLPFFFNRTLSFAIFQPAVNGNPNGLPSAGFLPAVTTPFYGVD